MTNSEETRDAEPFSMPKDPGAYSTSNGSVTNGRSQACDNAKSKLLTSTNGSTELELIETNGIVDSDCNKHMPSSNHQVPDQNGHSTEAIVTTTNSESTSSSNSSTTVPPVLALKKICGEETVKTFTTTEGTLVLTNYRLFVQEKNAHFNIPLGLVELVECRDIFFVHVHCKDARYMRVSFHNNESAAEVAKCVYESITNTNEKEIFAFAFARKANEDEELKAQLAWSEPNFPTNPKERFDYELKRMEFNVDDCWRVSDENVDYSLCESYPTHIIVPSVMNADKLKTVARFRSFKRFPAVVWR